MAKYAILKSFYASEGWQNFRAFIIGDRGFNCEHCGQLIAKVSDLTIHHIIELTPENVNDATIALNPDNVKIVHHDCHNKIHKRFGYGTERKVYIVFGAPLAGKKTFIRQNIIRGDIVVDMDRLYKAITMLPEYDKPDNILTNVRAVHNVLIDNIKTRYGKWNNAWIIGGYADKHKRDRLADDLGAEVIFCNTSKEECLNRLKMDVDRQGRIKEWSEYINDWFDKYMA
ncbi:MAG TPA: HNH endonuclease signature motif containing protein [Ruminiclostridium sp.]